MLMHGPIQGQPDESIVHDPHTEVDPEARSKRELVKVKERCNEITWPNHIRRSGLTKADIPELPRDSSDDPASDVAFDAFVHSVLTGREDFRSARVGMPRESSAAEGSQ